MTQDSDAIRGEPTGAREPHETPEIVPIELKAEQVLAVGCKNDSGVARLGQPTCGFASGCSTIGS